MIFSKIKLWIIAAFGFVVAFLGAALKIKTAQYKKEKKRATRAEAQINEVKEIAEVDEEITNEYSDAKREAISDVQDGNMPDNIRNRNDY